MYKLINRFDETQKAILLSEEKDCEMYQAYYSTQKDETGLNTFVFIEDKEEIDISVIKENNVAEIEYNYNNSLQEIQNSLLIAQLNADEDLILELKNSFMSIKENYIKEMEAIK